MVKHTAGDELIEDTCAGAKEPEGRRGEPHPAYTHIETDKGTLET